MSGAKAYPICKARKERDGSTIAGTYKEEHGQHQKDKSRSIIIGQLHAIIVSEVQHMSSFRWKLGIGLRGRSDVFDFARFIIAPEPTASLCGHRSMDYGVVQGYGTGVIPKLRRGVHFDHACWRCEVGKSVEYAPPGPVQLHAASLWP